MIHGRGGVNDGTVAAAWATAGPPWSLAWLPVSMSYAFVNLKPGVGKTTSAVWLAHALHESGFSPLLVDSDPASSALRWSELAGGFPSPCSPSRWATCTGE